MPKRPPPDDAWVSQHYPRLYRGAWFLCGNRTEAEDLAQETLIQAIAHWDQFSGKSQEFTWLYSILLRLHQKRLRSVTRAAARVRRWWEATRCDDSASDPASIVASEQWRKGVWSQVAKLPAAQQQAVMLRFAEELSYDEIGAMLKCSPETARTRVFYGLRNLRKSFDCDLSLPADLPLNRADYATPAASPQR